MNKIATPDIAPSNKPPFNPEKARLDFPILADMAYGKPLVYLDNAATSQKPRSVIEATEYYYRHQNANVHRGIHYLSDQATLAYEKARDLAKEFINAGERHEIIYTKGTTEGINLVANSFGQQFIHEGDEILISGMEHHANIVPWHLLSARVGARVRAIPLTDSGELDMEAFATMLNARVKLVAISHVSNTLGTINPVKQVIALAHDAGVPVLLDGAQAIPHMPVDVRALDVDFYAFSGHKMFGPTGTGILYGKEKWLDAIPPYQGGGDMIERVTLEKTTFNSLPHKFEAGTPNIGGFAGLGPAFEYLNQMDRVGALAHEQHLLESATRQLLEIERLRIIGTAQNKASVISFVVEGIHPSDIGTLLDRNGIAVRTGHHCTQPIMDRYGIPSTTRVSFSFYNTESEVEYLISVLQKVMKMFQ